MPIPTDCTLVGTWPIIDGVQASGHVVVEPVQPVTGGGYLLVDVPVTVPFVNGAISKAFASTSTVPGLQLRITERTRGARVDPPPYIVTPVAGTLNLATAPRGDGTLVPLYVLASTVGQPGGVASLDGAGHVPLAQLPSGSGVLSVTPLDATITIGGTGTAPTVGVNTIPEAKVTGLATDLGTLTSAASAASSAAAAAQSTANSASTAASAAQSTATSAASAAAAAQSTADGKAARAVVRRAIVTTGTPGGDTPPDTGGAWQHLAGPGSLVIPAAVGDHVEFQLAALVSKSGSTYYDVAVKVSGSLVWFLSNDSATPLAEGDPGMNPNGEPFESFGSVRWLDVTSDHISGGAVTFVVAVKSTNTGKIYYSPLYPLRWRAINYGPVS